jgi:hypothetical protein
VQLRTALVGALVVGACACACVGRGADTDGDATDDTAADALTTITRFRPEYVVGDLALGATSDPVDVPGRGSHRALRIVVGAAGPLDLAVWADFSAPPTDKYGRSAWGRPTATLFDATGRVVRSNDVVRNRVYGLGTWFAHLVVPHVEPGTYYLAFADRGDGAARFRASANAPVKRAGTYRVRFNEDHTPGATYDRATNAFDLTLLEDGRCSLTDRVFVRTQPWRPFPNRPVEMTTRAFHGRCELSFATDQERGSFLVTPNPPQTDYPFRFEASVAPGYIELNRTGERMDETLLLERVDVPACAPKTCAELDTCGGYAIAGCGATIDCGACDGPELLTETFDETATVTLPVKFSFAGEAPWTDAQCREVYVASSSPWSPIAPKDMREVVLPIRRKGTRTKAVLEILGDRFTHAFTFVEGARSPVQWTFQRLDDPNAGGLGYGAELDGYFEQRQVAGKWVATHTFVATSYGYVQHFASYDDHKKYHCTVGVTFDGAAPFVFAN